MKYKILPEGIETGDYCCIDDIHNIPKHCSSYKYISYDEDGELKQFKEAGNNYEELQKENRVVIENPIYKMSKINIYDEMITCMDFQSKEWKQDYINKIAEQYNYISTFKTNLDGQATDYQCKDIIDRFKKLYNIEPTIPYKRTIFGKIKK